MGCASIERMNTDMILTYMYNVCVCLLNYCSYTRIHAFLVLKNHMKMTQVACVHNDKLHLPEYDTITYTV